MGKRQARCLEDLRELDLESTAFSAKAGEETLFTWSLVTSC